MKGTLKIKIQYVNTPRRNDKTHRTLDTVLRRDRTQTPKTMKMAAPSLATYMATAWVLRSSSAEAFHMSSSSRRLCRLFSASSEVMAEAVQSGVSRLSTLQTLLSKHGAPGSRGCAQPGDLVPVATLAETPELLTSLTGIDAFPSDLHPHLFPISKSSSTGNYICALRRAYADDASYESSTESPWPIVESLIDGPGMRLLALNRYAHNRNDICVRENSAYSLILCCLEFFMWSFCIELLLKWGSSFSSEHFMRRIACESDACGEGEEIVSFYNDGLGLGQLKDTGLDEPYEPGSVEALG